MVLGHSTINTACNAWKMHSVPVLPRFINTSSKKILSAHYTLDPPSRRDQLVHPARCSFEKISNQYRRVDFRRITRVVQLEWPSHLTPPSPPLFLLLLQPVYDPKKTKKQQQTILGMEVKERRLVAKMQAGHIHRSPSSSTVCSGASTASPSTRSSTSSGSGKSRTSPKMCSFPKESRGVVCFPRVARVSPGAAFVPAIRPSARVDPRVSNLSGSGAIRR